jgi:hypothetical protein
MMKRALTIIVIVLIAAAYGAGFWPQYQKAQRSERELKTVSAEMGVLQSQVRLCRLQDFLLALVKSTTEKNYGDAATISTGFFTAVGDEVSRQSDPQVKAGLTSILHQRDAVTAALAKGDPSALGLLQPIQNTMFQMVNRALGGPGAATPVASGGSPLSN